ncbi:ATP-dependent endonuclease [Streptococcus uberis]|uniref:ATP-dependent nuclease n=1 Tax=Streptococcus uberis TaxID=1349 RepID=UPI000620332C|nr:AAA family ATPase [Streptococcus uberis]AUC25136.1 ATP-dependent endonuclease [Streptococcus uberis]KKF42109.1 nuclease [Streptococcus uberis Ab71]KKF48220.1 nuclease [Streptococcus uberis C5072]
MKLKKVKINNFRSFGERQIIEINNQTVLIGNNSSGKTTVLDALRKLFSDKQNDRIIRKSDFHLRKGMKPGQNSKSLFIETIFEFDELQGQSYSPAIPTFFEHFTVSEGYDNPFLRIRLESSWEDDGTVEGSIDTQIYFISSGDENFSEKDKHHAPRRDLDKIRLLYVPASRNPDKELGNSSGSMLSRLVNSINWTSDEINMITEKIDELNDIFLSETSALKQINQGIQKAWEIYHQDNRFSQANLTINSSEMSGALRQIALKFSPSTTEEAFRVSDLGDGLRSIFYFSLVDSILDLENKITKDYGEKPDYPRFKLLPPLLTILAIEEPENHIAPHHIGKLVKRFKELSNNDNCQLILTSHSPAIVKRIDPEDLRHLRIENTDKVLQTVVSEIQLPEAIDESYKYVKEAVQSYPELYFAKLIILGEGDSEELLIPKFFDLLGKEIDSSQISVVPLGGRHVNHFWKLLNSLKIPYITLLDFDNERYGGGWGRIKYISQHLNKLNLEFQKWFNTNKLDFNEIGLRECESIESQRLKNWFNKFEEFNVYFSSPLDIDFLMLKHYKTHYLKTLSSKEGPVVSYIDLEGNSAKVKLTELDCYDKSQVEGANNRKYEAIQATLKDKSGSGDSFTDEEKRLMIWYQYFFLGRGKPTTHMKFLSLISDEELILNLPPVFNKIVESAEILLGDK